jgi:hypothetical protein
MATHLGQHTFNCTLMGFRNTPAYTQREIDAIMVDLRSFARAFVDDIVIASPTLEAHIQHLCRVFARFVQYNIALKPAKCFIGYPSATVLGQRVDSMGLSTTVHCRVNGMPADCLDCVQRFINGLVGWLN